MSESIFQRVENFKFSVFDSVPKPDADTAYILYREGTKDILVITSQQPVLSSQIRRGGYDKKVTLSMKERTVSVEQNLKDRSNNFTITVQASLKFRIKEPAYLYFNHVDQPETVVQGKLLEILSQHHRKHVIDEAVEMEDKIRQEINTALRESYYLEFSRKHISVMLDRRAQAILESNLEVISQRALKENENELRQIELELEKQFQLQKTESERAIEEKQSRFQKQKMENIKALEKIGGGDTPLYLSYINGEISAEQFLAMKHERGRRDLMQRLEVVKQLADMDVLSGPKLERVVESLFIQDMQEGRTAGDGQSRLMDNTFQIAGDIIIEDAEEY